MKHVLNIAHRGFTREFPDNTLEAFEAAIRIPVDGIECDVRETADGRFVMFHDPELSGRDISRMSLAEIEETGLEDGFRVPTLEETLSVCRGRVKLNIELKRVRSPERFLGLVRAGMSPDDVFLTSFNRDLVLEMAELAPEIRRGIITGTPLKDHVALARETQSDALIVMFPHATAGLVTQARGADLAVFVWGLADMAQVRAVLGLEVDGIITDFPDEAAKELDRMRRGLP